VSDLKDFAMSFVGVATLFTQLPRWRRTAQPFTSEPCDLDSSDRIGLLLAWFDASNHEEFAHLALNVAVTRQDAFDGWSDGSTLVEIVRELRDGDYHEGLPNAAELIDALERSIVSLLQNGMASDDLERISDTLNESRPQLGENVYLATQSAIRREFEEIDSIVREIDSDSTLTDHKETLKKLAFRADIPDEIIKNAIRAIDMRIARLEDETETAESPTFTKAKSSETDQFDDDAMNNLFASLLERSTDEE
jgi:hypothetical protein